MARRVLAIISLILLLSTMAQAQSRPVSTGRSAALSKAAITDSCSGADINLIWIDSTQYGLEPHVTDGTVAGTHLLKDLEPGREGSGAQDCFELQGQLYFQTGRFVWRTNGSANGTTRIYSTPPGSFLGQMGYFRGRIYLVSSNELGATVYSFLPDGSDFQPAYITPQGAATKKELELTVGADAVYILE
jgi:ELWxxDGT repeat protein